MSEPIKKLNNLINAESFMQLHLVKGFTFTGKAGEIANYFIDRDQQADFSLTFNSFEIKQPDEKVERIRVSSNFFWMHFISPESLDLMSDFFNSNARDVLHILEVEKIRRLGWRNYFVHEFLNEAERDESLEKHTPAEGLRLQAVLFESEAAGIQLNIRLRKVVKTDASATPGLLIDIDAYREYKNGLAVTEVPAHLTDFKKMMRSEEFLQKLNLLVEPKNG